jgi:hypothetical protein
MPRRRLQMLYMLLICYDPTVPAKQDEQNLQPKHAVLAREHAPGR